LKEGSKILEDQLKLMDEKFLELRAKMDVTRNHFLEKLKKAQKESMDLRVKFSMATNGQSLDHFRPPKKKNNMNTMSTEGLNVTIEDNNFFPTQSTTPFATTQYGNNSMNNTNGQNNTQERRASSPSFAADNRRSSTTSPTNNNNNNNNTNTQQSVNKLDPSRKGSSFQEIKRLPGSQQQQQMTNQQQQTGTTSSNMRPISASHDSFERNDNNRSESPAERPRSAFFGHGLSNNPSLTSLSRQSKDKQENQIVRRIKSRGNGGKEVWTADRIHELLEK
jgi:hypothetical protein